MNDDTGTSYHSGGEIPKKITLMVNSALNAIGGRVVYIPYWPDYFAGIQVSGYPTQDQKLVPDVVLAGGIDGMKLAEATPARQLDQLAGNHPRISRGQMPLHYHEVLRRVHAYRGDVVPRFQ